MVTTEGFVKDMAQTCEMISIGDLSERLIAIAAPAATELCQHGAMACLPCVIMAENEQATMVVITGLLQGMLFRVNYAYKECNEREVPDWLLKRLNGAIARAGDLRFSDRFSAIWHKSENELHAVEAINRINADGHGDPFRQRASSTVECVNWTIKELNKGAASDLMKTNRLLFLEIVSTFSFFSLRNEQLINIGALSARSTKAVDISSIPPSKIKYDVFISYRRSDGLGPARLLKQELERRGYRCFLDVDKIEGGEYNYHILSSLRSSENFVFLMTRDAIVNLSDPDNPVRIELESARKLGLGITTVAAPGTSRSLDKFDMPESLAFIQGSHKYRLEFGEFFVESVDKIITNGFAVRRSRWTRMIRHLFN